MAYTEADLATAVRHVREGALRIDYLSTQIASDRANGFPTGLAEEALRTMRTTLELMIEHEAAIAASVAARTP